MHYGGSNGDYCTTSDVVVCQKPERDSMKRRRPEIHHHFTLTSWAFMQRCRDVSGDRNTREHNDGQFRGIIIVITDLNGFTLVSSQ